MRGEMGGGAGAYVGNRRVLAHGTQLRREGDYERQHLQASEAEDEDCVDYAEAPLFRGVRLESARFKLTDYYAPLHPLSVERSTLSRWAQMCRTVWGGPWLVPPRWRLMWQLAAGPRPQAVWRVFKICQRLRASASLKAAFNLAPHEKGVKTEV